MNVFEKIKGVREAVNCVFPEMTLEDLTRTVEFLANNWHGSKRKKHVTLSQQQLTVYELLLEKGYSPATVYKWLLAASAPQDVKEKLRNNSISLIDALKQKRTGNRYVSVDEKQFINAVIKCVEMFVSEPGEGYPGKVRP
ncbi:MAG: hypothetical protein ABIH53_00355 [archaeon]